MYIWRNFGADYTAGIAVAVASDLVQARQLVTNAYAAHFHEPFDSEWVKNRMDVELAEAPEVTRLTKHGAACFCFGGG